MMEIQMVYDLVVMKVQQMSMVLMNVVMKVSEMVGLILMVVWMALSLVPKKANDLAAMLAPPMEWRSWWAWRMELHLDRQHQFLPCQSCNHDILYRACYLSETKLRVKERRSVVMSDTRIVML